MTIKSMKFVDIDFNKFFQSLGEMFNFDIKGVYLSVGLGLISGIGSYAAGSLIPLYVILSIVLIIGGLTTMEYNGAFVYSIKLTLLSILIAHLCVLKPLVSEEPTEVPAAIYTNNYETTDANNAPVKKIAVKIYNRSTNELMDTIDYDVGDKVVVDRLYKGVIKVKKVVDHTMFLNYNTHYEYIR